MLYPFLEKYDWKEIYNLHLRQTVDPNLSLQNTQQKFKQVVRLRPALMMTVNKQSVITKNTFLQALIKL